MSVRSLIFNVGMNARNVFLDIDAVRKKIVYALQRATRGYDDTDVWFHGENFVERTAKLLTESRKNEFLCFYDNNACRELSVRETQDNIDRMIFLFSRCNDEDLVVKEMFGVSPDKDEVTSQQWADCLLQMEKYRVEAMELYSKWFWQLNC